MAVVTALAATLAASELHHHSSESISDIDYDNGHEVRFLYKRAPAKKGKGFFKGFTVAKKSFSKSAKGLGGFGLNKGGKGKLNTSSVSSFGPFKGC